MNTDLKQKETPKEELKKKDIALKVLIVFSVLVVLVCFFVFLVNYETALDDSGDWFPRSMTVQFYYVIIAVGAIIASVMLKLAFKQRVSLTALLVASVVLPILCYQVNRLTLKKDGAFSFLVDEGGIFHFITIGDYNFDGINDETYALENNLRTVTSWDTGHYNNKIIKSIKLKTTGKGLNLDPFTTSDESKGIIELHLRKDRAVYEKIEWDIEFFSKAKADSFSMTPAFIRVWGEDKPLGFKINYEISRTSDTNIKVVFDKDACLAMQNNSETEYVTVSFKFNG